MFRSSARRPWFFSPDGYLWETPGSTAGAGGGGVSAPSGGSPTSPGPSSPSSSGGGSQSLPGAQGDPSAPQAPQSPANQGPIPYERFEEINGKYKQLSWAEQYQPDEVQSATQLYRWLDSDPQSAYDYLTGLMRRQGYLKQQEQQVQQAGRQQPQYPVDAQGRPLPDVVIQETGQQFFSAEQAERREQWLMQQFENRLKPLEGMRTSMETRSAAHQQIAEAEANWPHFGDFAKEIYVELQRDRRLSLEGAYRRVVVPRIKQKERDSVIAEMRGKGNANGGINPGAPAPMSATEESKLPLKELVRREMIKRGIGT